MSRSPRRPAISAASLAWLALLAAPLARSDPAPQHGVALHGAPKYAADFDHFEYADPSAPKGGQVCLAEIGTFDGLTVQSEDEPFVEYGLVAETIARDPDNRWVEYRLRPTARFHDGTPITAGDVAFSLEALKTKGHPFYRAHYRNVARAVVKDPHTIRFEFDGSENRELPLLVGRLPVLSKAWWHGRDFAKTTLDPLLGSGPDRVEKVDPGRSITYRRVPDYWAQDLPVNRSRYDFDVIRIDYYRDDTVALEAFKAGEYDFRQENVAKNWAVGDDGPALQRGWIRKEQIPHQRPTGMQGFVCNTRKALFSAPQTAHTGELRAAAFLSAPSEQKQTEAP